MHNALIAKLEAFTRLSLSEKQALDRVSRERVRHIGPREDIVREGDGPGHVNLILGGWACRYKTLEDGRRQITAYFLPGDTSDLNAMLLKRWDHSIGAVSPVLLAEIPRESLRQLSEESPRIERALWWSALVAGAVEREWIVSLGQRTAFERLGHLFCELFLRLRAVGLVEDTSYEWPLTQAELGETTGLSTVHVNRTLQDMRAQGLIALSGRKLAILDLERLKDASLFNPQYLHLDHEGRAFDANEI
jgi:CRP-like cAMP-binding protein